MAPSPRIEPGSHCWKASALTTGQPCSPIYVTSVKSQSNIVIITNIFVNSNNCRIKSHLGIAASPPLVNQSHPNSLIFVEGRGNHKQAKYWVIIYVQQQRLKSSQSEQVQPNSITLYYIHQVQASKWRLSKINSSDINLIVQVMLSDNDTQMCVPPSDIHKIEDFRH